MGKKFNVSEYKRQLNEFPNITYKEYQQITDEQVRQAIAQKNKLLHTDTYNRTMNQLKGRSRSDMIETFTLSMRKAPEGSTYIVVDGIRKMIKSLFGTPITQKELDFAKDFYADQGNIGGVGYFDEEMWQKVVDNGGYVPLLIKSVPDGTLVHPKEPVLTVTGPSELAAFFEPMIIRPFYKSAVATTGKLYADEISGDLNPICEQGKRAGINEESHMDAVSSLIVGGGLTKTSNDAAALAYKLKTSGTTAHRFYESYNTEDEAMEIASQIDGMVILTDLIDAASGTNKVLQLKKEGKNVGLRLDSGDMPELVRRALEKQKALGMTDPQKDKVYVSDGVSTIGKFREVCNAARNAGCEPREYLGFGIGGGLVANGKTRDELSAKYGLTNTENGPTLKLSNDKGKESIPGVLNIEIRDGKRYLVQESEPKQGERLLKTVYDNGTIYYGDDDLQEIENARQQALKSKQWIDYPTEESDLTHNLHEQCRKNLKAQTKNNS